jgi:capsid assembly protease
MTTATTEPGAKENAQQQTTEQAAAEARVAERARVSAIMGCDEAKGRETLANHLAMNTDMSADAAKAVLAAAPKADAKPADSKATNAFEQAMNKDKHPNVGADSTASESGAEPTAQEQASGILANYALATGRKTEKTA